jgi:hypothetical protein
MQWQVEFIKTGHGRSGPGVQAPAFRPTFYVGLNVQLLGLNVQILKYLFFSTVALVSLFPACTTSATTPR